MNPFYDKVVVVTGGARGIGKCIALTYAEHGAKVVVADRLPDEGQQVLQKILERGTQGMFQETDVSDPKQIQTLMEKTVQTFGCIDILINNAGITCWKSPYELSVEEWDIVLHTNLRSVFLCSREAAKSMRLHGGGVIVNIASTRALMSEPNSEAYAASKGGILALTHALAVSLGPDGIRVNAISPGWIETGDVSQLREIDHLQHPVGRVGTPEDIARACLFLTHPDNGFLTGENLVVDGGMTRKMIYEP
jgi:NAD(P)-dependent dehydrogenase (short-subunit alcohol dehydrogenase family)